MTSSHADLSDCRITTHVTPREQDGLLRGTVSMTRTPQFRPNDSDQKALVSGPGTVSL